MTIEGADGRRYLDCLSGAGTLALGHNHPVVLEAIRAVLDSGAPLHALDLATPVKDAFTTALFDDPAAPTRRPRARPVLRTGRHRRRRGRPQAGPHRHRSRRTARLLRRLPRHDRRRPRRLGRHRGRGAAGAAAGRSPGSLSVRLPLPVRCRRRTTAPNSPPAGPRTCSTTPRAASSRPAGMILEPVQGEGGVIPAPDTWLRRMRELTAARGIPLIADEVQTGVGRTGAFWAVERSGIVPDVMVLSKAIGGSLPLAVIVYREELDAWQPGAHAGTFRGNQLAMAAGTATLAYVRRNGLAERAALLGDRMLAGLRALAAEHPCVGDVRGRGLMLGVELVDPDAAPGPRGVPPTAPRLAAAVRRAALDRGLIVELGGRDSSVVRLLPPLTITEEQSEAVLERLADALVAAAVRA